MSNRRFALALAGIALLGLGLRWFWILEMRPECGNPAEEGPPGCLAITGGANVVNDPRYLHEVGNLLAAMASTPIGWPPPSWARSPSWSWA